MQNWKPVALSMWKSGASLSAITSEVNAKYFPDLTGNKVYEKVRSYLRRTPEYMEKHKGDTPVRESVTYNQDGSVMKQKIIALKEGQEMTPELVLELHGFDKCVWKVRSYTNNFYEVQKKGGVTLALYQSKLIAEPRKDLLIDGEEFVEFLEKYESKRTPPKVNYIKQKRNEMLEVSPFDVHLGKLAWEVETRANYDTKIAQNALLGVVDNVISRVHDRPIAKILYPNIGQDFFHYDNPAVTTTGGTPQDTDSRWQKMFYKGFELQVEVIERLSTIAPVEAMYIASNHDFQTAYHLAVALKAYFQNDPNVEIDIEPTIRKYRAWGLMLIGYGHGDWDKTRLHSAPSIEVPQMWGESKFREMHVGHLHSEIVKPPKGSRLVNEEDGVIVRHLSSISATDAWHSKMGFIGAVRKSQNFIYDKEKGLTDIIHSVV